MEYVKEELWYLRCWNRYVTRRWQKLGWDITPIYVGWMILNFGIEVGMLIVYGSN